MCVMQRFEFGIGGAAIIELLRIYHAPHYKSQISSRQSQAICLPLHVESEEIFFTVMRLLM